MKDVLLIAIIVIGMLVASILAVWLWAINELTEETWGIVAAVFMSGFVLAGLALPGIRKADQRRKMQEKRIPPP